MNLRSLKRFYSPSPGSLVQKYGEQWREVAAAKPAWRGWVASGQFHLALHTDAPRGSAESFNYDLFKFHFIFLLELVNIKSAIRG